MKIRNRLNITINIVALCIIMFNLSLKILCNAQLLANDPFKSVIVPVCYILLFSLWIVTICWRVVHKHIKWTLLTIATLEIFWITIRWIKFECFKSEILMRYGWYMYYLPMLMIFAMCLVLAILIGKPDDYHVGKRLCILPVIAFLLFLLVLTNDLHSFVFVIPKGIEGMTVGNYTYGIGYWAIVVYMAVCGVTSLVLIFIKSHRTNRKPAQIIILFPFIMGWIISFLNVFGVRSIFNFYRIDITVLICLSITATIESCIQSGLILTNSGYDTLFRMSSVSMGITDKKFAPMIFSDSCKRITTKEMCSTLTGPIMLDNGIRLSSAPIRYGHVVWQDDLSELNDAVQKCEEINEYLKDKNEMIQKDYEYQRKECQLVEKNRLYNSILNQLKTTIGYYAKLVEQLADESDPEKTKELAIRIALVSTFIKRRINIIFLDEEDKNIDPAELYLSVEEILKSVRRNGIECMCSMNLTKSLTFESTTNLFEKFYNIISELICSISSLCVYLNEENENAVILMRVMSDKDISYISNAEKEDSEWVIRII